MLTKALYELNERRLSAPAGSNNCDELARFDLEVEATEDPNVRPCWIAEVHVLEDDVTVPVLELGSGWLLGVDDRPRVEQIESVGSGTLGITHVGNEAVVGKKVSAIPNASF